MSETESRVHTETVRLNAEGTELESYLAYDDQNDARRPGVLVIHEWWGLNDHVRRRAQMLAGLGYAALAVDMYGGGQVADNPEDAGRLMNGVLGDMSKAESRIGAALEYLQNHDSVDSLRIAAIGYCFGGGMVLHAARTGMPLAGVVSFHGALGSFHKPAPGSVRAKIMVCHGGEDVLVPDDDVAALKEEMQAAGADLRFIAYPGALHGFTNPEADANGKKYGLPLAYDQDADQRSWQEMQAFFKEIFA
ncbi:MAG: dienelactone hydrolase family protein [Gammaproteobacteria bacterium]|nr:MAG: dienelactone hydrolase family protein [Gammaproteobacteria bacterium]